MDRRPRTCSQQGCNWRCSRVSSKGSKTGTGLFQEMTLRIPESKVVMADAGAEAAAERIDGASEAGTSGTSGSKGSPKFQSVSANGLQRSNPGTTKCMWCKGEPVWHYW